MISHSPKCDKKALYRAFLFALSILFVFGISASFVWSVQSPLVTSINNEVVVFFVFFVFLFFFIRKNTSFHADEISFLVIISVLLSLRQINNFDNTAIIIYFLYSFGFLVVYSLIKSLNNDEDKKIMLNAALFSLILSSLINIVIVIYQWLGYANDSGVNYWVYPAYSGRMASNLAQPNHLSTLLIMGIYSSFLFVKKNNFLLLIAYIVFSVFCIVLTGSRTAYLSLFFCAAFTSAFLKDRELSFLAWLPLISFLIFSASYDSWSLISPLDFSVARDRGIESGRYLLWEMALDAIQQKLWIGYGIGNLTYAYKQLIPLNLNFSEHSVPSSSHNIILDYAIYFGLPYVLFALIFLLRALKNSYKDLNREKILCFIVLVPILVHSLLEYPQNYAYFLLPMAFLFGFIFDKRRGDKESSSFFFVSVYCIYLILSVFLIKNYYEIEENFKKIRLQQNGVEVSVKFSGAGFCVLRDYCEFLNVHLLSKVNNIDDPYYETLSDRIATPFVMEVGIISSLNRKNYGRARNEIINYCLFFSEMKCDYLRKRLDSIFPDFYNFYPFGEIDKIKNIQNYQ